MVAAGGVRLDGGCCREDLGLGAIHARRANDRSQVFQHLEESPPSNPNGPEGRRPAEHLLLLRPKWFPVRPPGGKWLLGSPVPGNEFPGNQRMPSGQSARPGSAAARGLAGVGCHGQAQPCVQWPSSTLGAMAKLNLGFHGQAQPCVPWPSTTLGAHAHARRVGCHGQARRSRAPPWEHSQAAPPSDPRSR